MRRKPLKELDDISFEICPECEAEVMLKGAKLKTPIKCPSCGKYIMPCNLCYDCDCGCDCGCGGCDDICKWQKLNRDTGKIED